MDTKDPHTPRHSKSLLSVLLASFMTWFAVSYHAFAGDSDAGGRDRPHAVWLIGEREYRSEGAMPMLARILKILQADQLPENGLNIDFMMEYSPDRSGFGKVSKQNLRPDDIPLEAPPKLEVAPNP